MSASVDCSRWRKCRVCGAVTGEPCADLTYAGPTNDVASTYRRAIDQPHSSRKPRSGGA